MNFPEKKESAKSSGPPAIDRMEEEKRPNTAEQKGQKPHP
jgi:hypothetical protein